jgi:hypothetical protein
MLILSTERWAIRCRIICRIRWLQIVFCYIYETEVCDVSVIIDCLMNDRVTVAYMPRAEEATSTPHRYCYCTELTPYIKIRSVH